MGVLPAVRVVRCVDDVPSTHPISDHITDLLLAVLLSSRFVQPFSVIDFVLIVSKVS